MKILMVLEALYEDDYRVRKEVRTLVAAGHRVRVLSPGTEPGLVAMDGAELERVPIPGGWRGRCANLRAAITWIHPHWRRALRASIASFGPDVVHVHDLPLVATAVPLAQAAGAALVADLHENTPALMALIVDQRRWIYRRLHNQARWARHERAVLASATRVICVIEEARERLLAQAGVPAERIRIVANYDDPMDDGAVGPEVPRSGYRAGYLGAMNGHRGLPFIIAQYAALKAELPELRLELAGDGAERPGLEALAVELGAAVDFPGWVPIAEVHQRIRGFDVVLIVHDRNGLTEATIPNKLFIAMAVRRPVIVTDCGPLRRIVEDAGCGLVIPWGDGEAFRSALRRLHDPRLRAKLGEQGRRALEARYSWRHAAAELRALYDELGAI